MNVIERIPENKLSNRYQYISYRTVIRLYNEIRKTPIFDTSTSDKGKESLNECLYKAINLIELLPDILDYFRMHDIGITSHMEKTTKRIVMQE